MRNTAVMKAGIPVDWLFSSFFLASSPLSGIGITGERFPAAPCSEGTSWRVETTFRLVIRQLTLYYTYYVIQQKGMKDFYYSLFKLQIFVYRQDDIEKSDYQRERFVSVAMPVNAQIGFLI